MKKVAFLKATFFLFVSFFIKTEVDLSSNYHRADDVSEGNYEYQYAVDKEGAGFRTELFRNVDFGIFDINFRPIVLIEINDNTHFRKDRQERDESVALILKKAHVPLVTFWTKDGIDAKQIYNELKKYL